MAANLSPVLHIGHPADLADIVLDAEFRDLVSPPPAEQQKRIVERLFEENHTEVLTVWCCGPRKILLLGYECFPTLRLYGLSCALEEREFAGREHARQFIVRRRLAERNLSRLELMYLHGVLYHDEKHPHGGDRRSSRRARRGKTAEAIADNLCQRPRTVRRAAEFVTAVKTIVAVCGAEAMPLLFSRTARLGRKTVIDLAAREPAPLQALIDYLRVFGKLPPNWRGDSAYVTFPRDHHAMVEAMLRRFGGDWLAEHAALARDLLDAQTKQIGTLEAAAQT